MINLFIAYALATILYALVDAIRIKAVWGKKQNIDHSISFDLALYTAAILIPVDCVLYAPITGHPLRSALLWNTFAWLGIVCIRLAIFDPTLNFFRILTKTNPTGRLDYVSGTTSSWVDRHLKLGFWQKRGLAVVGWALLIFIYYKL